MDGTPSSAAVRTSAESDEANVAAEMAAAPESAMSEPALAASLRGRRHKSTLVDG